jgi:predicted TPR repeat methyltransferase
VKTRGKLTQTQWVSLQGVTLCGFEVTNSKGKLLAIGAIPSAASHDSKGFVVMHAKRYLHDSDLVRAIERLTGLTVRKPS